jgi:hypothetical protein
MKKGRPIERPFVFGNPGCSRAINDVFKNEARKFNDEFFQSCIFLEQCVNVTMVVVVALMGREIVMSFVLSRQRLSAFHWQTSPRLP